MNWKSEHILSYLTDSREDLSESDVSVQNTTLFFTLTVLKSKYYARL